MRLRHVFTYYSGDKIVMPTKNPKQKEKFNIALHESVSLSFST